MGWPKSTDNSAIGTATVSLVFVAAYLVLLLLPSFQSGRMNSRSFMHVVGDCNGTFDGSHVGRDNGDILNEGCTDTLGT